jgi:pimeloyl-ACP methyl ester carboxylesterase
MQPDPARTGELFYGDCDPEVMEWAKRMVRVQSSATMVEPLARPAWRRIPSTYVVCTNDKAIPAHVQRSAFAVHANEVIELQAGHSPFLSQPDAVANLLAARAN